MTESPYDSFQKSELYAILMVLFSRTYALNSQYAVILRIKTTRLIPNDSELTLLFIHLQ